MRHRWVKAADSIDEISFGSNRIAELKLEDKLICMARMGNDLYAFAHKCPHASGLLAEGHIDPMGNIVCPVHQYKFCLKNGINVSGEGFHLKNWPVEIRGDGVYVGFELNKLFGLF